MAYDPIPVYCRVKLLERGVLLTAAANDDNSWGHCEVLVILLCVKKEGKVWERKEKIAQDEAESANECLWRKADVECGKVAGHMRGAGNSNLGRCSAAALPGAGVLPQTRMSPAWRTKPIC